MIEFQGTISLKDGLIKAYERYIIHNKNKYLSK